MDKKNKIIVILGPTSGGKTGLAVKLAAKYDGEVISADSRQVYKYMDIGTGKDLDEYFIKDKKGKTIKIRHHLIDVCHPKNEYNLAKYVSDAQKAIVDILKRGKLPIIAGGSGLYLQALVDGYDLNKIKPDKNLRKELEKLNIGELFEKLKKINKKFAESLNESDQKNKRRLVRYIEISSQKSPARNASQREASGKVKSQKVKNSSEFLIIGLNPGKEIINKKIYKRLLERLEKENMVGEVENLRDQHKLSWKRLEDFGLEYKLLSYYLQEKISYDEMVDKLFIAIRQFAKRQMTWFRRWERQGIKINWISSLEEAEKLLKTFLK